MSDTLNNLLASQRSSSVLQGIANPPLVNPLAAMGSALGTAKGVYELRGAQAKEAAGQAFLNSIDPATGQPRQSNFLLGLKGDPATAMAAQEAAQSGQTLDADTYKLHSTRLAGMYGDMTDLLSRYPQGVPLDQIQAAVQRGVTRGDIPPGEADGVLRTFSDNPRQNSLVLTQGLFRNMSAQQKLEETYGTRPQVDTGPTVQFPQVPPARFGGTPSVGKGLTPSDAASAAELKLSDGTVIQVPLAMRNDILRRNPALRALNPDVAPGGGPWPTGGRPPAQGGQGQGGTGNTTPSATPPVSQPPPAPTPQFQPSAARADAAAVRPPPQAGTTPPPAFVKQQETGGANASRMEGEAQVARTQLQPLLQTMLPELEATGNTGAGQKTLSFLQQLAIRSGVTPPRFDPKDQQASSEALGKAMTRYQGAQLQALGTSPSDSRQSLAEGMSPSMGYSREGNRKIVHSLMGNNDALDTMYTAWMGSQTRANNPGGFDQWREAFTKPVAEGELKGARFDPTVFAVNRMPPPEQYRYLKDLQKASPGDYEQFKKNFALGQREGWVKPLGGQ